MKLQYWKSLQNSEWYWRVRSNNGEQVCSPGEGHKNLRDCLELWPKIYLAPIWHDRELIRDPNGIYDSFGNILRNENDEAATGQSDRMGVAIPLARSGAANAYYAQCRDAVIMS